VRRGDNTGGTMHPEEDYFRLGLPFNADVNGGNGFTFTEEMKLIREERKLLEEMEREDYNSKNY
jgi:hypothetical protein